MYLANRTLSLGNVGGGCWSVNFTISNEEQDRAANVSLNSDSIQDTVWKYYMLDVLVVNGSL